MSSSNIIGNNIPVKDTTNNISKETMYCSKCGTELLKGSAFCSSCGNKIEQVNSNTVEKSTKIQNPKVETYQAPNNEGTNWIGVIVGIIGIIVVIVTSWNFIFGNGVDGDYWFSDGSGYVHINKDTNRITMYDEYNKLIGSTKVRFTGNKTFVYSDGLLEYTGTINGKKLTVKCENDKMGGFEATKK